MSGRDVAEEGQGIFLAMIDFDSKCYLMKAVIPVRDVHLGYQYQNTEGKEGKEGKEIIRTDKKHF